MPINYSAVSQIELCKALGVQQSQVKDWVSKGCPQNPPAEGKKFATFNIPKVFRWRVSRERDASASIGGGNTVDSEQLERYRRVKADAAEYELGVKKGKYIDVDQVRSAFRKCADRVRNTMQGVGKRISIKVAKESDPMRCEDLIDSEIRMALRSASENVFTQDDSFDDSALDDMDLPDEATSGED